jgi:hypothetical protein
MIMLCENDIVPKLTNDTEGRPAYFIYLFNCIFHITGNWTIDVIYNFKTQITELVEVNSFGCELAAGSALFHWVRDKDVMYGHIAPHVELRYVVSG